jgi:hypothetical protein
MSYGPSVAEMLNISATYVVKILKGAKPGDLPVEQPIARAASVQLFSVGTNATCSDLHPIARCSCVLLQFRGIVSGITNGTARAIWGANRAVVASPRGGMTHRVAHGLSCILRTKDRLCRHPLVPEGRSGSS